MYHTDSGNAIHYLINDEVVGSGLHQFQYEIDGDCYHWHYRNNVKGCLNNDCHVCDRPDRRADFRFAGSALRVIGLFGPDQGIAHFLIDGILMEERDLYAAHTKRAELFSVRNLPLGEHVCTVRVTGLKNEQASGCAVTLDCAEVIPFLKRVEYPIRACLSDPGDSFRQGDDLFFPAETAITLSVWGSAFLANAAGEGLRLSCDGEPALASASGWLVPADGTQRRHLLSLTAEAGTRLTSIHALCALDVTDYNDNAERTPSFEVEYHGAWQYQQGIENCACGDRHRTEQAGDSVRILFKGCQLTVRGNAAGSFSAQIDGKPIPPSSASYDGSILLRTPPLNEGMHEATLTCGAGALEIDSFSVAGFSPPTGALQINPDTFYQTIEGFGASSGWSINPVCKLWKEENRERIADLLYDREKGIGLKCFRFDLGAGSCISDTERIKDENWWRSTEVFKAGEDAPYDFSVQQGQTWMMAAAKKRGTDRFFAYIHSAPFWMNKNGHTQCDDDTTGTNLLPGYEGKLMNFLIDVVEYFRTVKGLPFDYLSPINEPGWKWTYPGVHEEGCHMERDAIMALLRAAVATIRERGNSIRLLAPEMETVDALGRILPVLRSDASVWDGMNGRVSAHSYFSDMFEKDGISSRIKLAKALAQSGVRQYWQTEYCLMGTGRGEGRDMGMTPALWIAQTIHYDLTLLNACSWQWWLSLSPGDFSWKDGLVYSDWRKPGDEETVLPSKMLWALGQFSRFIRRGDRRVACKIQGCRWLLCSAYQSAAGDKLTAVLINLSSSEHVLALPQAAHTDVYVTDDRKGWDIRRENGLLLPPASLIVPPRCVLTLVFTAPG